LQWKLAAERIIGRALSVISANAEAICEAAQRPTMRFVAVKSEEQQASSAVFRVQISWCGNVLS
jgi:transposase